MLEPQIPVQAARVVLLDDEAGRRRPRPRRGVRVAGRLRRRGGVALGPVALEPIGHPPDHTRWRRSRGYGGSRGTGIVRLHMDANPIVLDDAAGDVVVVVVEGEHDIYTAPTLRERLDEALGPRRRRSWST